MSCSKALRPRLNLSRFHQLADLFMCASEHEGFCIPLVEAMHYHLPILAYDAGAIAETLNGSGVLYREKNVAQVGRDGAPYDDRSGIQIGYCRETGRKAGRLPKPELGGSASILPITDPLTQM